MQKVILTVNGREEQVCVEETDSLLDLLREQLHMNGTKDGCREGECGACTVLVNGRPVDACLYSAMASQGCSIETIEGIGQADGPSALQRALLETGGLQCGFCTPGIVMVLTALLKEHPEPSPELVRESLSGNICRCTGYAQIEDAVVRAVGQKAGGVK